jgi:hypothetical protein
MGASSATQGISMLAQASFCAYCGSQAHLKESHILEDTFFSPS